MTQTPLSIRSAAALCGRIRERRKQLGLTQATVAGYAGVSERLLVELENGRTSVSLSRLIALLNLLNIRIQVDSQPLAQAGTAVKRARKALNLTQVDCAGFLGIGVSTLKAIENNHPGVSLEKLFTVTQGLALGWRPIDEQGP